VTLVPETSERDAASCRDPSGYVFVRGGRVFRAIDGESAGLLRQLATAGLFTALIDEGRVVPTDFVPASQLIDELRSDHPGYAEFLEHQRVWPITYPYEWSVSMLADAGIATLDLQLRLLQARCSLKDASAYNVQFVNGRPLFIDVSSIEQPQRLDVWFALGQAQQMFTFPLLLAHRGWDLRSYFLANLGGKTAEQVVRALGPLERWRPRYLLDVTLPALIGARAGARRLATGASSRLDSRRPFSTVHPRIRIGCRGS